MYLSLRLIIFEDFIKFPLYAYLFQKINQLNQQPKLMRSLLVITFYVLFIQWGYNAPNVSAKRSFEYSVNAFTYQKDIRKFKFFEKVLFTNPMYFAPQSVLWTAGTNPNFGTQACGASNLTVSVETFVPGVTNGAGQGNNVHCVVHLGKVQSFGGVWACIQNFDMTYVSENGLNDVFSATISSLPPGLYEFTCACSDAGVFTDPTTAPGITWIGTSNPPNAFTNGQFTVSGSAPNDECSGTLVTLNQGANVVNNNCSIDGMVGFQYTVTSYGPVSITATGGSLSNSLIGLIRQGMPCSGPGIDPSATCFAPGTVLFIQAGNNDAPCFEYGDFTINVTQNSSPVNPTVSVTEPNGTNDGNICTGDGFTLTVAPTGASAYSWALDGSGITNTTNTLTIANSSIANDGTYQITVTDANGCTGSTSILINVLSPPTASNTTISECETSAGSGTANFVLTDADAGVLNGQTGLSVTYHISNSNANTNTSPLTSPYNSANTTIFARVTDPVSGCFAVSTVTLTVNTAPTGVQIQNQNASNSPTDFTICQGTAINLQVIATGSGTLNYSWMLPGGTATGTPLNIASATPSLHSGNWVVTVTDSDGCTATDDINITVTSAPANDNCADALPFTTSGNNSCASQDITTCGTNGEASVWYDYTVPNNIKTLTFTLSGLTGGVLNVYDGCGGSAIGTTCTTSVTIDCPDDGDILKIYVSSPTSSAGSFTLSVVETGITATNDECTDALTIPSSPICEFFTVAGSTSVGACPESFSVPGCGLDYTSDAVVWYSFTTPAGTNSVQFQNVTGVLTVFDACPATAFISGGNCISGAATVNVTPNTTYYIGIGIAGGSGPVGFQIQYNAGPVNDMCGGGNIDLGSSGSGASSNACGGPDFSLNCAASSYENSVWFSVTVDPGSSGIQFTVTGSGSSPMTGGGAGTLFQTGCGGTAVDEACFSVGSASQILCLTPGTYDFQIATSATNAGDFNISVSQITGGPSSPANDLCENAQNNILPVVCAPVTISGNNTNACSESFSIGGCNFGTEPTTWHTVTLDANATTISITNITGGAYLGIFESSPCGTNMPTQVAGAGCVTSNTTGVPISGGSTYYIAVGHSSGAPYSFQITQSTPPPNDTPCTAETIGTATQTNTCCANPDQSSICGNGTEASVWFVIPAAPGVLSVDITFNSGTMTAPFVIDAFSGTDCNAIAPVPEEDFRTLCNIAAFTVTMRCLDFENEDIYIRVSSNEASCGNFSLSAVSSSGSCTAATICADAPNTSVPTGGQACLPGCNLSVCGDGACDPSGNATYYSFTADPTTASAIIISVENASFTPIISIANDCFNPVVSCFNGNISDPIPVPPSGTVWVRIEALSGTNLDDDFTVCANAFDAGAFDCYSSSMVVTRPQYPNANPNGPYCSGEIVNFCWTVDFIVSPPGTVPPAGNNCQWLQGIVPVAYDGWDLVELPLSTQAPPGGSSWLGEGAVDYNFANPQYSPFNLPDGSLGLNWGSGGGLGAGSPMPAGWYWASQGNGPDCTDPGNPDTAWGLPAACGSTQTVQACFNLKVKEFQSQTECQNATLKLSMFAFADGELGCYTSLSCALSTPFIWTGQAACNSIINITGDDKETCSGVPVTINATASNPAADIILTTTDNPNVTGETLSGTYPLGQMSLFETLVNTSGVPQIVQYTLNAVVPNQVCQSPPHTINVTVYPALDASFTPDPAYICKPGDCINLIIFPTGGTENYTTYTWSGPGINGLGPSATACPTTTTTYTVVFADNLGCQGTKNIDVEVKDPVIASIDPINLAVCKDGIVGNSEPLFATISSGQGPFILDWTSPPGIIGFGSPFFQTWDDMYTIIEETSQSTSGIVNLTVTDDFGCTGTAQATISVDQGPEPTFTNLPVPCGSTLVDLVANFVMGSSTSGLARFDLFTCDDTFIASGTNNTTIFEDIDMSVYGNCFKLSTVSGSGCIVERTLTVQSITGTQVTVNGANSRCANGNPIDINITNPLAFTSFAWSNGSTTSSISVSPAQTTTYTVTATQSNGCTSVANHIIEVNEVPLVSYSGSTSLCQGESTILTASSTIIGSSFLWTRVADGITFTTPSIPVTTPGSYLLTTTSPDGCISAPLSITVIISNSLSPTINELSICDGTPGILNAGLGFDSYLWSTGETTSNITVNSGGSYWVNVAKSTCIGSDTVVVVNNVTPLLNIDNTPIVVCRTNDGFGPSFANFNAAINPPSTTGNWREITTSGVDLTSNLSNVSFIGVPVGTYLFEFTTNGAISPCVQKIDTLSINVNACQCPGLLPAGPLCNNGSAPINLNTLKGNPGLSGIFSVITPAGVNLVNGVFNPSGLAAGTYTIQWDLTPNCKPTTNIVIHDAPDVQLTTSETTLCNDNATGSTTLQLNTLLPPSSPTGSWKLVSGPANVFTVPDNVNGNGLNAGDELIFRYVTNTAMNPCRNDSAQVKIVIRDCKCPEVIIRPQTLCNGENTPLDLNGSTVLSITPSNVTGVWSSTLSGAVTNGSIFNAFNRPAGSYTITFTLNTPITGCQNSYPGNITISQQPIAEVEKQGTACNVANGNGQTTVQLFDLLKSGYSPGGVWTQTGGQPSITIPSNGIIDLVGQPIGSVFRFTYTRTASAPCTEAKAEVTVTVVDCNCPTIVLGQIPAICTSNSSFDLKPYSDSKPGVWKTNNPALIITNGVLNLSNLPAGTYEISYALTPPPPAPCPIEQKVLINISNPKNAGTGRGAEFCLGATDIISLFDRLDNEDTGGTWSSVSGSPSGFNPVNGTFSLSGNPTGTYTFRYAFANQAPCPNDFEEVIINITPLPVSDAGTDKVINCDNKTAILGTNLTSTGPNLVYEWKVNGNIVGNTPIITVSQDGNYSLTVRNNVTNCASSDNVLVTSDNDLPLFDLKTDSIKCFGDLGQIIISNLRGGKPPYSISIDGGINYSTLTSFNNLKAGTYKILVKDANGCINDQWPEIRLIEPLKLTVSLGNDFSIFLGSDTTVNITGQFSVSELERIIWAINSIEDAAFDDKPSITLKPTENTEVEVTIKDKNGCVAMDNLLITIKKVKPECVPNVIALSSAAGNAYFSINCSEVEVVSKYYIYDRWGNLMYARNNLNPNDITSFWNGTFKGQEVNPGVYVYHIEMVFKDGSTETRTGDVTVIK